MSKLFQTISFPFVLAKKQKKIQVKNKELLNQINSATEKVFPLYTPKQRDYLLNCEWIIRLMISLHLIHFTRYLVSELI